MSLLVAARGAVALLVLAAANEPLLLALLLPGRTYCVDVPGSNTAYDNSQPHTWQKEGEAAGTATAI